jgi:hypothetical protein
MQPKRQPPTIAMRLRPAEKAALKSLAHEQSLTQTELIRRLLADALQHPRPLPPAQFGAATPPN